MRTNCNGLVFLSVLAASCLHQSVTSKGSRPVAGDIPSLILRVEQLRQLGATAPVSVVSLESLEQELYQQTKKALCLNGDSETERMVNALVWWGRVDLDEVARVLTREAVAGMDALYVDDERKIFVRANATSNQVLAHEYDHVLQHQYFPSGQPRGIDERLALQAMREGQASLIAALATTSNEAAGLALSELEDNARRRIQRLREARRANAGVASASLHSSFEDGFLYGHGTLFALNRYKAGGVPALNQALAHPPLSTAEVLHPEKYQVEVPHLWAPISFPLGWREITSGTLGELLIGEFVSQTGAAQNIEGWAGDRYTIAINRGGQLVVAWVTAWDSLSDSNRFLAAIRMRARHWTNLESGGVSLSSTFQVRQKGRRVAVVRGVVAEASGPWAELMAHLLDAN